MTQSGQLTGICQQRFLITLLSLNGQLSVFRIYREVELIRCTRREAGILALGPLHRSTGTRTLIATLLVREIHLILHTNLITIINKRNTRHGEEEGHRHLQLVRRIAGTDVRALVIMVGRWNSNVAEILGGIESLGIVLAKFLKRTLSLLVEIAVLIALLPFAPWSLTVEEQRGIALKTEMDVEIDVEAGRNGLLRISPL